MFLHSILVSLNLQIASQFQQKERKETMGGMLQNIKKKHRNHKSAEKWVDEFIFGESLKKNVALA